MDEYTCPNCKRKTSYNEMFDSYFCKKCNIWTSQGCGDVDCFFCKNRPEKPFLRNKNEKANEI